MEDNLSLPYDTSELKDFNDSEVLHLCILEVEHIALFCLISGANIHKNRDI